MYFPFSCQKNQVLFLNMCIVWFHFSIILKTFILSFCFKYTFKNTHTNTQSVNILYLVSMHKWMQSHGTCRVFVSTLACFPPSALNSHKLSLGRNFFSILAYYQHMYVIFLSTNSHISSPSPQSFKHLYPPTHTHTLSFQTHREVLFHFIIFLCMCLSSYAHILLCLGVFIYLFFCIQIFFWHNQDTFIFFL